MQSRLRSLIEAVTNVVVGYVLALITQNSVSPRFGLQVSLGETLTIGMIFVGVSLLRSYALRRLFVRFGKREPAKAGSK